MIMNIGVFRSDSIHIADADAAVSKKAPPALFVRAGSEQKTAVLLCYLIPRTASFAAFATRNFTTVLAGI